MLDRLQSLYARLASTADLGRSPFLLLVRLYWGWQFAQSGWGKLHNLDRVTDFFVSLNIPLPAANAHFIAGLEFFGGILLLLGLGSRLIALLLTANMLVAYWTADREALFSLLKDPGKFYAADPFTFLMASALVLIFGAGLFSVDTLLARKATSNNS
ncbi:MAG: DoxX family protein [Acidobacteriota bacterium]|nr:DoxX family protein [Acidobacteriota bacterium]